MKHFDEVIDIITFLANALYLTEATFQISVSPSSVDKEPIQGVGDMLGLILIFLVADQVVSLENVDQYQPVEMSRSGNGKFGISEVSFNDKH